MDLKRLSFVTILVTDEDPEFSVDDIYNQAYSPLPPEEDEFTLKGLNAQYGLKPISQVKDAGTDAATVQKHLIKSFQQVMGFVALCSLFSWKAPWATCPLFGAAPKLTIFLFILSIKFPYTVTTLSAFGGDGF